MHYKRDEDRIVLRSMALKEIIAAECFQLEISSQEFVRQACVDYFIRKYKLHPVFNRVELEQVMKENIMRRSAQAIKNPTEDQQGFTQDVR